MVREPIDEHGGAARIQDISLELQEPRWTCRLPLRQELLATETGRKFLIASLDDQAEVVRLAAAAALLDKGSTAARLVLEALAATHSPNAASAKIILGSYP
jgi:hypothetical protein